MKTNKEQVFYCFTELLRAGSLESLDVENLHRKCHSEYDQLKEEFERYKLRAQSVLKNKSSKVCQLLQDYNENKITI